MSTEGQNKMANCIFSAFEKYKHEYDKRTITTPQIDKQETKEVKEKTTKKENNDKKQNNKKEKEKGTKNTIQNTSANLVYKIQVFSSRTPIAETHYDYNRAKKFKNAGYYFENNWYKYTCCEIKTYKEAEQKLTEVQRVFKDAMIVAFNGDKKISIDDAKKIEGITTENKTNKETIETTVTDTEKCIFSIQIFSSRTLIPNDNYDMRRAKKYGPVKHFTENGWYKYTCAETDSYTKAKENLTEIREIFKDAVIVAFKGDKQISLDDVIAGDKDACINFVDFFKEVKQHIHSFPFVINDFSYIQSGPRSVKCSGVIDSGFIEKGDRVSIFCKGGKEVAGECLSILHGNYPGFFRK